MDEHPSFFNMRKVGLTSKGSNFLISLEGSKLLSCGSSLTIEYTTKTFYENLENITKFWLLKNKICYTICLERPTGTKMSIYSIK